MAPVDLGFSHEAESRRGIRPWGTLPGTGWIPSPTPRDVSGGVGSWSPGEPSRTRYSPTRLIPQATEPFADRPSHRSFANCDMVRSQSATRFQPEIRPSRYCPSSGPLFITLDFAVVISLSLVNTGAAAITHPADLSCHLTGQDRTVDVDGRDPAGRPGRSTGPHPDGREEWDPRLSRLSLFPVAAPHRRTFSPPPWSRQQSHVLHSPLLVVRTSHWSRTDDARPALLRDDGMPAHRLRPASFSVIVKGRDCWGKSGWTARRNGRGCHPDMPHNLVGPPPERTCVSLRTRRFPFQLSGIRPSDRRD